jgi:hypothetical protein
LHGFISVSFRYAGCPLPFIRVFTNYSLTREVV